MSRKRINISVSEQQYETLTRVQGAYGLKNVCELTRALLSIYVEYVDKGERRKRRQAPSIDEDIRGMFDDLGDWENEHGPAQSYNRNK